MMKLSAEIGYDKSGYVAISDGSAVKMKVKNAVLKKGGKSGSGRITLEFDIENYEVLKEVKSC